MAKKQAATTDVAEEVKLPGTAYVGLSQLIARTTNPRVDYGNIAELANSIKENGLKIALRVKDTGKVNKAKEPIYEVMAGNRRLKAFQSLGVKYSDTLIKVEIAPEGYTEEQMLIDDIATNDGLNLSILEQADVFQRLRTGGMADADIAKKVSKSQMHVHDCLLLWDKASPELKAKINKGKTSASAVIETLKAAEKSGDNTDEIIKKAEAIAGDKKVTGKHITEAQGKAKGSKINNTSSKPTKVVKEGDKGSATPIAKEEPVEDKTYARLISLQEALELEEGEKIDSSFEVLRTIIGWLDKKVKVAELSRLFIVEEED